MTNPKIQFREVEPAEIYLRQVDSLRSRVRELEAKLCRAREALYGEWDGELSNFVGNIEDALSSTGPCRHEELLHKISGALGEFMHKGGDNILEKIAFFREDYRCIDDENKRLKEAVEYAVSNVRCWDDPYLVADYVDQIRRLAFTSGEAKKEI